MRIETGFFSNVLMTVVATVQLRAMKDDNLWKVASVQHSSLTEMIQKYNSRVKEMADFSKGWRNKSFSFEESIAKEMICLNVICDKMVPVNLIKNRLLKNVLENELCEQNERLFDLATEMEEASNYLDAWIIKKKD